ncbi:galactose oxidase early set domain-containing protein [Calothrix rhizosoleniae]|uniref:galactose oxidase early set domain-containing protein n=1 Tax=Calothrix rhizosoleniae TaxID=888997 RepID=UPI00135668E0|nr:galactose oxidase early set domain-containing protein [Calothrix rhizosoleniae]
MPWKTQLIDTEILAVHAALIPTGSRGQVLIFGGDEHNSAAEERDSADAWKKTRVYDIASEDLVSDTIPSPDSDVFCAGHSFLPDGRLLIGGGTSIWPQGGDVHEHGLDFGGHRRCWAYNARDKSWEEVAQMVPEPGGDPAKNTGGRWYPTLLTLGNGDSIAFFGHPRLDDSRHRNTIAERYNVTTDSWTGLPQMADPTPFPGQGGIRYLMFPRVFLLPDGDLFFATGMPVTSDTTHHSTRYNPNTGDYVGTPITEIPSGRYAGWDYPAVLLPLLPTDNYRPRVLYSGGVNAFIIDLGDTNPSWGQTPDRQGATLGRRRIHSMSVLLPTGEVCQVGGVHNQGSSSGNTGLEDGVLEAEIYDPGIDWAAGTYTPGGDSWATKEAAQIVRNYHSTALLMPDGRVMTAGSNTNARSGNPDTDVTIDGVTKKIGIKNIEIYEPDYIAQSNRPTITSAPQAITYNQRFSIESPEAANIQRIALIRFGSATHGHNYDQRYVGLRFNQEGSSLECTAPPNGNVAPPGYYMLWLVDDSGRPCTQASIVRLAPLTCTIVTDRSTFSSYEVEALLNEAPNATFPDTIYVYYDGYLPEELGDPISPPQVTLTFAEDDQLVPVGQLTLVPQETLFEDDTRPPDKVQRVTFVFDVRFGNDDIFDTFTETRNIRLTFTLGGRQCFGLLRLIKQPNPYMRDIDPNEDNPHWLSTDLRVFQIREERSHRPTQPCNC